MTTAMGTVRLNVVVGICCLRILAVLCQSQKLAVQIASSQTVCPDYWAAVYPEGADGDIHSSVVCMKASPAPATWEKALETCHSLNSGLLGLDSGYYQELGYFPDVHLNVRGLMGEAGIRSTWLSLHVANEKLLWESELPRPYYNWHSRSSTYWQWKDDQPANMTGNCAVCSIQDTSISPLSPDQTALEPGRVDLGSGSSGARQLAGPIPVSLVDCDTKRPFICVNKGLGLAVREVEHCERGWVGNYNISQCFWYDPNMTLTYPEARWKCQNDGGHLVSPSTNLFHELVLSVVNWYSRSAAKAFWIGLKREEYSFTWESGQKWDASQGRFGDDAGSIDKIDHGCTMAQGSAERGSEWSLIGCQRYLPFVCQKEAKTAPVKITKHPEDITTSRDEMFASNYEYDFSDPTSRSDNFDQLYLECEATGYNPNLPVVWVKDGKWYLSNGLPPEGLRLYLDQELVYSFGAESPASAPGRFHCEVWGFRPYERVASRAATVRMKDVLQYKGTLRLPNSNYTTEYIEKNLANDVYDSDAPNILSQLLFIQFERNFYVDHYVQVEQYRPGSVLVDFSVNYLLPQSDQATVLKLLFEQYRVSARRDVFNTLEQAMYDAIMRNLDQQFVRPQISQSFDLLQQYGIRRGDIEIRSLVGCPRETTKTKKQKLTWRRTPFGQTGTSVQLCLSDGKPLAKRPCLGNETYGAYWGEIQEVGNCKPPPTSDMTESLQELADTDTTDSNVDAVAEQVEALTNDTNILVYTDVAYASQVMENVAGVRRSGENVGNRMVKTASNLLKVDRSKLADAQKVDRSSTRIVESLEIYSTTADLDGEEVIRFSEDDVAMEIWDLPTGRGSPSVIGFGEQGGRGQEAVLTNYYREDEVDYEQINTAIILSDEALDRVTKFYDELQAIDPSRGQDGIRMTFALYQKQDFFLTPEQLESSDDGDDDAVNSAVVASQLGKLNITGLKEPIVTIFKPRENMTGDAACVYWDFELNDGKGNWSTKGCSFLEMQGDRVVCQCDHLTNFAILTDYYQDRVSDKDKLALSIITILGLALSILGLTLTILSFLIFKKLRKNRSQKVLFNLAVSLLCVYVVFLAGIERTSNENACIAVAALLHYFLLVSFAWMLVEAVLQYLRLVKVIGAYVERFMLKAALPAWLLPAVPVGVIAAIDYKLYRGPEQYCWMERTPFYYAFLVPIGSIIVINTVLYILIVKSITCDRPKNLTSTQSKSDLTKLQIRASICVFVLLGVTWVFGFLAIEDARLVFQYLFCIFNALQGFLIFVFHTLREKGVRDAWRRLCCPKKQAKKRERSKKYVANDSSDSNANSRLAMSGTESSDALGSSSGSKSQEPVYDNVNV